MVCGVSEKPSSSFASQHWMALTLLALAVAAVATGLLGYYQVEEFALIGRDWSTNLMIGGAIVATVDAVYLLVRKLSFSPELPSSAPVAPPPKKEKIANNNVSSASPLVYITVEYGLFEQTWHPLRLNGKELPGSMQQRPLATVRLLLQDSPSQPIDSAKRGTREKLYLPRGEKIPAQMQGSVGECTFGAAAATQVNPQAAVYFSAQDLRFLPPEMRQRAREENVKRAHEKRGDEPPSGGAKTVAFYQTRLDQTRGASPDADLQRAIEESLLP